MNKLYIICLILTCTSCLYIRNNDDTEPQKSSFKAVTINRSDFENSTELMEAKPNIESGKIYVKDNYLIINEPNEGFHIYNNSNQKTPIKIGFLKILGSTDLTIKGDIIYANNAVDLIALKIDLELNSIEITKRVKNIFPEKASPDGYYNDTPTDEVLINWVLKN
ncbi:hypothetical protein ACFQ1R_02155 [Mariniflexile jejuense]|uniref:Uncharacterized protein n=1 Tax=Mariniflexile jejuense TaxID=1173582 RepID=A0ABW3JEQ0_9FLAO